MLLSLGHDLLRTQVHQRAPHHRPDQVDRGRLHRGHADDRSSTWLQAERRRQVLVQEGLPPPRHWGEVCRRSAPNDCREQQAVLLWRLTFATTRAPAWYFAHRRPFDHVGVAIRCYTTATGKARVLLAAPLRLFFAAPQRLSAQNWETALAAVWAEIHNADQQVLRYPRQVLLSSF